MITYDQSDPEARFLYEKAGFAAYSGYRAFELEVDERFDDAKQEAVLTFWDLYRKDKGSEGGSFGGRQEETTEEGGSEGKTETSNHVPLVGDVSGRIWLHCSPLHSEPIALGGPKSHERCPLPTNLTGASTIQPPAPAVLSNASLSAPPSMG
jgi:hypothetical protein